MKSRDVPEWVGRTPNSAVPQTVVERLLERCEGKCEGPCHRAIGPGNPYDVDHIVALKDWLPTPEAPHGNRESNLQILCVKICHKSKTKLEALARARTRETRKHMMRRRKASSFRGWRRLNGEVVFNPNYRGGRD